MTEKWLSQSLSYFLPLYYLTKGREGVHFRQGGVHFLIIPITFKNCKPSVFCRSFLSDSQHNTTRSIIQSCPLHSESVQLDAELFRRRLYQSYATAEYPVRQVTHGK